MSAAASFSLDWSQWRSGQRLRVAILITPQTPAWPWHRFCCSMLLQLPPNGAGSSNLPAPGPPMAAFHLPHHLGTLGSAGAERISEGLATLRSPREGLRYFEGFERLRDAAELTLKLWAEPLMSGSSSRLFGATFQCERNSKPRAVALGNNVGACTKQVLRWAQMCCWER